MNNIKNNKFSLFYNSAIGGCDLITGIFLIFKPSFIMNILNIQILDSEAIYLSYIGVFVFSTGFAYFIPYIHSKNGIEFSTLNKVTWILTAYTRLFVSTFVFACCYLNHLKINWTIVGITDFSIALVQYILLTRNNSQNLNDNA